MTSQWAKFWAVDLHVHTPGSSDANESDFGTPDDIVQVALDAGLDAIAITDHNTAAWCDKMASAAESKDLVILPGVELSTSDGHLLGVWEEGTKSSLIEDVLIGLGIQRNQFGNLDIVSAEGMAKCAMAIKKSGGVAIAAHIDKERGILNLPVKTHVNDLLRENSIGAYEYVWDKTPDTVAAKLGKHPMRAMTQGSDAYDSNLSRHAASGIGIRRTWIKAARPDLCGLRHALEDPDLRVSLVDPAEIAPHPTIDSLSISGGFLKDLTLDLSPDLNCLLGGTGAGKSLVLESLRFALDQQVDASVFKSIGDEVDRRLQSALRDGSEVCVEFTSNGDNYRAKRTFDNEGSAPQVDRLADGIWIRVDGMPEDFISIAAYSQGEILEYARQPVGRVGLIDAHLDLGQINTTINSTKEELKSNAANLIVARDLVKSLEEKAAKASTLTEREAELSKLFDDDLVKSQSVWSSERRSITSVSKTLASAKFERPAEPAEVSTKMSPEHDSQFEKLSKARDAYRKSIDKAEQLFEDGLKQFKSIADQVQKELESEFREFSSQLDQRLSSANSTSLPKLREDLQRVQQELGGAQEARSRIEKEAAPGLDRLLEEREELLGTLKEARDERRVLRRNQAATLNKKTSGSVRIDIPSKSDKTLFRSGLDELKVGSRLRDASLVRIADNMHPYNLVRALWTGDVSKAGNLPDGVEATDLVRLHTNIADRDLWTELLELQIVDTPDMLNMKFRKPEAQAYDPIEELSHGQKCTAVLVILLTDGSSPVLVDQPEDALHAPWIEDYLVERLRALRGTRQYVFATRSPGLVVSADSEQLITMRANATTGAIEATGSLERIDLNKLALHHLEGGKTPFGRRTKKLQASLRGTL